MDELRAPGADIAAIIIHAHDSEMVRVATDGDNNGPLHYAAMGGNMQAVALLLDLGINPNIPNRVMGNTPLHHAAINGRADIAQALISKGANLNAQNRQGKTPLHYAAEKMHDAFITACMRDTNPNIQDKDGMTPLHRALQDESVVLAIFSTFQGRLDVRVRDNRGNSPLMYVRSIDILLLFTDRWPNILSHDVNTTTGDTLLHHVMQGRAGNGDLIRHLAEVDALKLARNHEGETPFLCSFHGRFPPTPDVLRIVMPPPVPPIIINDASRTSGNTALHYAAAIEDNSILIEFLLNQGADVHLRNTVGQTPLDLCANGGYGYSLLLQHWDGAPYRMAFGSGLHSNLGANSFVHMLDDELAAMIMNQLEPLEDGRTPFMQWAAAEGMNMEMLQHIHYDGRQFPVESNQAYYRKRYLFLLANIRPDNERYQQLVRDTFGDNIFNLPIAAEVYAEMVQTLSRRL